MKKTFFAIASILILLSSCTEKKQQGEQETLSGLLPSKFEGQVENKTNALYTMKNSNGMEVCVTNFGGRIVSVMVPDKNGEMKDVVLGFGDFDGYKNNRSDFGAIIGRYGNRIAGGKFTLDRVAYTLRQNNGENTLHGGPEGFQYRMFDIVQLDSQTLECSYLSRHMEEKFPGNLQVTVTYKLTNDNAIDISYRATTDRATVVNLTNHSYFNLSGDPNKTVLDHIVYLDCDQFTETDDQLIPTGKIGKVAGTPMDFTKPTAIGDRINDSSFVAIKYGKGYDHNFIFNKPGDISNMGCKVICPSTGITLEVYTIEPAVQFYTGNFLDGTLVGKKDITYQFRTGFCLETQHYPDSPNHPDFPTTVVRPEEEYISRCIYKFGVEK